MPIIDHYVSCNDINYSQHLDIRIYSSIYSKYLFSMLHLSHYWDLWAVGMWAMLKIPRLEQSRTL